MSSLFEILFLFWLVVLCLLSSLDKIDFRVNYLQRMYEKLKIIKQVFLVLEWIILIGYFCKNNQFPCPWCKLVLTIENILNVNKWKNSTNQKTIFYHQMIKMFCLLNPSLRKILKNRKMNKTKPVLSLIESNNGWKPFAGVFKIYGTQRDCRDCTPHNTSVIYAPVGHEVRAGQCLSILGRQFSLYERLPIIKLPQLGPYAGSYCTKAHDQCEWKHWGWPRSQPNHIPENWPGRFPPRRTGVLNRPRPT